MTSAGDNRWRRAGWRAASLPLLALIIVCGVPRSAAARPWTRAYIRALPDSAFAGIETDSDGSAVRHLPHHDRSGRVDLAHVRNALSRLSQVHWINPAAAAAARQHLLAHLHGASGVPTPRAHRRDPY